MHLFPPLDHQLLEGRDSVLLTGVSLSRATGVLDKYSLDESKIRSICTLLCPSPNHIHASNLLCELGQVLPALTTCPPVSPLTSVAT